jgi:hypothetical protein
MVSVPRPSKFIAKVSRAPQNKRPRSIKIGAVARWAVGGNNGGGQYLPTGPFVWPDIVKTKIETATTRKFGLGDDGDKATPAGFTGPTPFPL